MHDKKDYNVPAGSYGDDIEAVLVDAKLLHTRIQEMADRLSEKYKDAGDDLILVCVLKGAVFFITDFARAMSMPTQIEFMAGEKPAQPQTQVPRRGDAAPQARGRARKSRSF